MTAPRPENLSKPLDIAAIEPYLAIWANTIGSVLGQVAAPFGGKTLAVDWKKLPAPDSAAATSEPASVGPGSIEPAGMIFLNTTLAGTLRGEQAFGLSLPLARWLAQTFMGEPVTEPPEGTNGIAAAKMPSGTPPELSVDHRDALEEIFRQVAGVLATSLKPKWGEVQIHVQAGTAPAWPSASNAWIRAAPEVDPPLVIEVRLSSALVATIRSVEAAAIEAAKASASENRSGAGAVSVAGSVAAGSVAGSAAPSLGSGADKASATKDGDGAVNLDLLKNVPLDLTLRFGQRRMLLQEILELGPGSVIELDRRLKEPVDLLLDGRVLARGEVVVIQGHYGLRVTEVASASTEQ